MKTKTKQARKEPKQVACEAGLFSACRQPAVIHCDCCGLDLCAKHAGHAKGKEP